MTVNELQFLGAPPNNRRKLRMRLRKMKYSNGSFFSAIGIRRVLLHPFGRSHSFGGRAPPIFIRRNEDDFGGRRYGVQWCPTFTEHRARKGGTHAGSVHFRLETSCYSVCCNLGPCRNHENHSLPLHLGQFAPYPVIDVEAEVHDFHQLVPARPGFADGTVVSDLQNYDFRVISRKGVRNNDSEDV